MGKNKKKGTVSNDFGMSYETNNAVQRAGNQSKNKNKKKNTGVDMQEVDSCR